MKFNLGLCSSKHAHRKIIDCNSNQLFLSIIFSANLHVHASTSSLQTILYGCRNSIFVDFFFLFMRRRIFETIKDLAGQFNKIYGDKIIVSCVSGPYIYAKSLNCSHFYLIFMPNRSIVYIFINLLTSAPQLSIHVMSSWCGSGRFGFHFREIGVFFREIMCRHLKCVILHVFMQLHHIFCQI